MDRIYFYMNLYLKDGLRVEFIAGKSNYKVSQKTGTLLHALSSHALTSANIK